MSNKKGYEQEKISMKDSKKMIVGTVLYALLDIGIIYASLCLGYIHPFFWVYASLVSSVFAGIPYLYLTARWQKFGVGTLFAFLVAGACALMGEGTILNWGLILLIGIMTDVVAQLLYGQIVPRRSQSRQQKWERHMVIPWRQSHQYGCW